MQNLITKLAIQKNNKNRVSVFINERYSFSINIKIASSLKKGLALSFEEIEKLKAKDEPFKAYEKALGYIAIKIRSKFEVKEYLKNKGYEHKLIDEIVELKLKRYLNDEIYAKLFIENRNRFNPKSAFAISYELKKKGISEDIIEKALKDIDNNKNALSVIEKNRFRWKKESNENFKKKALVFLQRRGFDFDTIYDVLDKIQQEGKKCIL